MQAWQNVKVTNEKSAHFGRAGRVVRVEGPQGSELVMAELDADGVNAQEVDIFAPSELAIL